MKVGDFVRYGTQHGIVESVRASLSPDWNDVVVIYFPGGVPNGIPSHLRAGKRVGMDEGLACGVLDLFTLDPPRSTAGTQPIGGAA